MVQLHRHLQTPVAGAKLGVSRGELVGHAPVLLLVKLEGSTVLNQHSQIWE